jgi:hypothetical protein
LRADQRFRGTLRALKDAFEDLAVPWMVIGGVAVIAAGVPRETVDVDATVLGRQCELDTLLAALARHGITPRHPNARQIARERQVLLLQHESGVTLEVTFGWLPFEEHALARAVSVEVEGIVVPVAQPEDLIVYKTTAWRTRDQTDVSRLLIMYLDKIDIPRVRALIADIAQVLDDPERLAEFDVLVAKARKAAGRQPC